MRALLLLVVACGPRDAAPIDYGPPPQPIDPIACSAARLEHFAARIGAAIEITTEQIVDAARIDKLPCKPSETDDACLSRARARPVPAYYEVAGVTIGKEITQVDFIYDLDGRRFTDSAESMQEMVARLKQLQAGGHKVTIIRAESAPDAGSRHAAIAYRGVGGQQRRLATLRWRPDASIDPHARAEDDRIEIRSMQVAESGEATAVVTCGP